MDIKFWIHNTHHHKPLEFATQDPHLRRLQNLELQYKSKLLDQLDIEIAGIYSVGGGRQVGKTTLLKQWMLKLINLGINPKLINFFSGELIHTYNELFTLIQTTVENLDNIERNSLRYILIDEITYIKEWDRAIKYAADSGILENVILLITGSDLSMMKQSRMTFPGRRGKASITDFHLYPLSFYEYVNLKDPKLDQDLLIQEKNNNSDQSFLQLNKLFEQYLLHGGYLTAINDYAQDKIILPATVQIYSDWIRGDILKRNKQEHYLREIISAILKHYTSLVTWNNLAKTLSIEHHKTISDYIAILQDMDAVFVQHAIIEDKLTLAPKKAKKIIFKDPFIYHAMNSWINNISEPFIQNIQPILNDAISCSKLVESVVVSHYSRFYETYYIKAEGEVDIAYIDNNKFWPIEVKWTNQIRSKDLKQIAKYKNGLVLTKSLEFHQKPKTEPLIWHLYSMAKKELN